jgi:hypothetical protein
MKTSEFLAQEANHIVGRAMGTPKGKTRLMKVTID